MAGAGEPGNLWLQIDLWKDRGLTSELVKRAAAAGYEALCLSVDTAALGKSERDVRRGFTLPPKIGLFTILDGMIHPGWTWQFITSEPIVFAKVACQRVGDGSEAVSLAEYCKPGLAPDDTIVRYHIRIAPRTTFTLEESLAEQARELGINISAAARQGVAFAVRAALSENDRAAYERHPEEPDPFWTDSEAWSAE